MPGAADQFSQQFSVYLGDWTSARHDGPGGGAGHLGGFDPARVTHELYAAQIRDLVKQHQEIADYARRRSRRLIRTAA